MQSAPATIPAMTAVNFPAGFTPADATLEDLNRTRSLDQPAQPGPLGQPHRRDQARARDQVHVIKDRDRPGPPIL